MAKEKSIAKELKNDLFYTKKNAGLIIKDDEIKKSESFSEKYKNFLNKAKTEREAIEYTLEVVKKKVL